MAALAAAAALLGTLASSPAYALALGRITVQSALGEPLRAEVDVPQITTDEAASLRVVVAAPEAFKAAGFEYAAAVVGIQVSLQKRPDGRSFLRLSSTRPVAEPFVDLILEASWTSGRVVRDYTMLFDPPGQRQSAAPVAPTPPAVSRPAAPPVAGGSAAPFAPSFEPPAQAVMRPTPSAKVRSQPAAPKAAPGGQQVTVRAGDTAGAIAVRNKAANISLDQMLVALLRSNPDAFIGGNVNRLRSGSLLDMPSAQDAGATPPAEATSTIVAQARSFNDFRQKLASGVRSTQVEGATRQAGGKVQANVDDRAAGVTAPDKLTLSKGALQAKATAEDKIAREKQSNQESTRVAELSKNIGDLNRIAGTPAAASAASAAFPAAAKVPGLAVEKPAAVSVVTPPASVPPAVPGTAASATKPIAAALPASAPTAAPTTIPTTSTTPATPTPPAAAASQAPSAAVPVTASAVTTATTITATQAAATAPEIVASSPGPAASAAAPAVVNKPAAAALPPPELSLIDQLTDNPLVLPGLGALLALLAGFGFYRYKKRSAAAAVDSSFLESRLQPDSFFGASGGQRIDTSEAGNAAGSSLVYSPSQLDASGDVDPVAEADVYLAYGRDLQAEEILKEALKTNSSRVAIHAKLMEIYAKRRDVKGFEVIAARAFTLTGGKGPEWDYVCEMGRDLDPANTLYSTGGQPNLPTGSPAVPTPAMLASYGADTIPVAKFELPQSQESPGDFGLDLDFSIDDQSMRTTPLMTPEPAAPASQTPEIFSRASPTQAVPAAQGPAFEPLDMNFGSGSAVRQKAPAAPSDNGLSFTLGDTLVATKATAAPAPPVAPTQADSGMLEFDLGSLSLDLDEPVTARSASAKPVLGSGLEDPLETKFALAEEFRSLGDNDGARDLANEVVASAQGGLKSKAKAFLNTLA